MLVSGDVVRGPNRARSKPSPSPSTRKRRGVKFTTRDGERRRALHFNDRASPFVPYYQWSTWNRPRLARVARLATPLSYRFPFFHPEHTDSGPRWIWRTSEQKGETRERDGDGDGDGGGCSHSWVFSSTATKRRPSSRSGKRRTLLPAGATSA